MTKTPNNRKPGKAQRGKGPPRRSFGHRPHPDSFKEQTPALPEIALCEITAIDPDGEAIANPVDWNAEHGKPPRIFLAPSTGHAALALGERALLRLKRISSRSYNGTVLRRIQHGQTARFVGLYYDNNGVGRVMPSDRRQKDEVMVNRKDSLNAQSGELVLVELIGGATGGLPKGKIIERLGDTSQPKAISLIAIRMNCRWLSRPKPRKRPMLPKSRFWVREPTCAIFPLSLSMAKMPATLTMPSTPKRMVTAGSCW